MGWPQGQVFALGAFPTPPIPVHCFFFPDKWEGLMNWNKNPGGVILERQAKCQSVLDSSEVASTSQARKGWGILAVSRRVVRS